MTEKKRYIDASEDYDCIIRDNIEKKDYINSQIVDLVNEQEERIRELKIRNERQYEILKEITNLMCARDWEALEKIVEDWEESDRLLQAEWNNCGDVE